MYDEDFAPKDQRKEAANDIVMVSLRLSLLLW